MADSLVERADRVPASGGPADRSPAPAVNAAGLPVAVATVYGTPLPPGATPLTADDPIRIGEYRLMARLASAEPGTGYLARVPGGGRAVVKVAVPRPAGGNRARRNFAEAAAARLPGRYVAGVLGRGNHAGLPYLAREYAEGLTLAELVAEDGRLDPTTLNSVAVALAAAIAAIHDAGGVHGNLKPSNVMVTLAGVRLLDHGLARRAGEPRPSPAVDVRAWARLVRFAGTGRQPDADAARAAGGAGELGGARGAGGVGELAGPLGPLVDQVLAAGDGEVPSSREILLRLVCPAAVEVAAPRSRWRRRREG